MPLEQRAVHSFPRSGPTENAEWRSRKKGGIRHSKTHIGRTRLKRFEFNPYDEMLADESTPVKQLYLYSASGPVERPAKLPILSHESNYLVNVLILAANRRRVYCSLQTFPGIVRPWQ